MVMPAQMHQPGTATRDTVETVVIPIILVPGVMGSRLQFPDAAWDPDSTMAMAPWAFTMPRRTIAAQLNVASRATILRDIPASAPGFWAGRPREIPLLRENPNLLRPPQGRTNEGNTAWKIISRFWENRGWGEVPLSFYFPILRDLANGLNPGPGFFEPRPVYACGYDWRQSNRDSARTLARRINQALEEHPLAHQVVLVTHSQGGLVARSMLAEKLVPEDKVAGVVHTVIPADGAPVAYRRFFTGAITGKQEPAWDGDIPLRMILGDDPVLYAITQAGLRGPIELLPHPSYPGDFVQLDHATNRTVADVYQDVYMSGDGRIVPNLGDKGWEFGAGRSSAKSLIPVTVQEADRSNIQARLREARSFAQSIAGVIHPRTFLLIGGQQPTDVGIDLRTRPTSPGFTIDRVTRTPEGDSTVPVVSAEFRTSKSPPLGRETFAVDHGTCFLNAAFRQAVLDRCRRLP